MKLLTYKPLTHCFIFSVKTFGKYKSNEDQYELVSQYRTKVLIQEKYCQKQRKHTKKTQTNKIPKNYLCVSVYWCKAVPYLFSYWELKVIDKIHITFDSDDNNKIY